MCWENQPDTKSHALCVGEINRDGRGRREREVNVRPHRRVIVRRLEYEARVVPCSVVLALVAQILHACTVSAVVTVSRRSSAAVTASDPMLCTAVRVRDGARRMFSVW